MKLWIKIIRNEKIIKDTVTEGNAENAKELHALLADVCDRLNCPVPLVTTTDASICKNSTMLNLKRGTSWKKWISIFLKRYAFPKRRKSKICKNKIPRTQSSGYYFLNSILRLPPKQNYSLT